VAVWDHVSVEEAIVACPWVADELRQVADGFQALAGASMGALGDRLDETLRAMVTSRCAVRTLEPGETIAEAGQPVRAMHIIGAGRVELVSDSGEVEEERGPGDFLFAAQMLSAGSAPKGARAGKSGALVLVADRGVAHELMVSVPPLLEVLADE
jgi:signal-transduction protein with cAMP-binding, CBS, and nucleotidyltransferase domain